MDLTRFNEALQQWDSFFFADKFLTELDTNKWTVTNTDSSTAPAVIDGHGGGLTINVDNGADNDELYVASANELFKVGAGQPIDFRAELTYTEANTDDANIFVGLASGVAADLIVDNGAGMRTTGDIIGFYKVDGGTKWNVIAQINGTASIYETDQTSLLSGYFDLRFSVIDQGDLGRSEVMFYINGSRVRDSNGNLVKVAISHTSATEMAVAAGVKNGSANAETMTLRQIVASSKY